MAEPKDIPRWAKTLKGGVWERVNELLYDGWQASAVMTELKIPEAKRRSLQQHAKKYRNRRILAPLARLSETLAGGAEDIGEGFVKLLTLSVEQGLSDETKTQRTAAMLSKFLAKMMEQGAEYAKQEAAETRDETKQPIGNLEEDLRRAVRDVFGVHDDQ